MKILYFYQYFSTPEGYWSTRVYELAKRWIQKGDSVTVVTAVFDRSDLRPKKFISKIVKDQIQIYIINIKMAGKQPYLLRMLTFAAYVFFANWCALFSKADVVIASSGPLTVGIPGLIARWVRRKPLVFEVRDLWPEGAIQLGALRNPLALWFFRGLEKLIYQNSSRIVTLSQGMKDWIEKQYGFSHIDVATNFSTFNRKQIPDLQLPSWANGKKIVVYAGALGRMDNVFQILLMAEELKKRGWEDFVVVILGEGKDRPFLEDYVEKHQLGNFKIMGSQKKEEVAAWLSRALCALMVFRSVPVLDTVSPNKMFDALSMGVPMIQTTQGWIKKLFEEQHCGLTIPPDDPKLFADAILRLDQGKELQAKIRENALRVSRELFHPDVIARKMRESLLLAVATQKSKYAAWI